MTPNTTWQERMRQLPQLYNASKGDIIAIESFISQEIERAVRERGEELNDCSCKEKWTFGVVHRKDKPCYWPPREDIKR